ncbi:MAG: DNA mismatch repair protein MutS, partial [Oscillospiraceae bacterium]
MPTTNLSPMMQQYFDIKAKHQDHILFFRLGDFYEMFYDDAKLASKELEITLTGKECGQEERAPMCGVPYHSCEAYIANLIKKGYKVAVCEQLEDPKTAKGLVKRDVIRVITPGTVVENSMLDESSNNYIASVFVDGEQVGVCFCDVSTGELQATEFLGDREDQKLINEVGRFAPREILLNQAAAGIERLMYFLREKLQCAVNVVDEEFFSGGGAAQVICRQFNAKSLQDLGIEEKPALSQSLYSLLEYLYSTQKAGTDRITQLILYSDNQYMHLDLYARRNLELTETLRSKERRGTLLWVLDRTKTAMGKRLIRSYIENPLTNPALINKRLNAVQELYGDMMLRGDVREMLTGFFDMERIMTRIIFGNANPREMKALGSTIARLPQIKKRLEHTASQYLQGIFREIDALEDVSSRIEAAIEDEPAITLKEGGVIKSGYDASLDELRDIVANTKQYIARIEQKERERTGIKNLKIGFNRVFGYYI